MTPINTWLKKVDKTRSTHRLISIFFAAICMRGYFPVGMGLDGKSLLLSFRIRHGLPLCTDFDLFFSCLSRDSGETPPPLFPQEKSSRDTTRV
ncbi:hypothetical protein TNCV_4103311 [Trichonephila clavipes]|nr:hypothetical protein TNCV_4103311 [Trichonephila clavipes]